MVDYLSDHYGDGLNVVAPVAAKALDPHFRVEPGKGHGRRRYKRAQANVTLLFGGPDTIRMMTFKSNDRLIDLQVVSDTDPAGVGATMDVGLFRTGLRHDGAVEDIDLFENGLVVAGAVIDASVLPGAVSVVNRINVGQALWEMAALGGGPLTGITADPGGQFDIAITAGIADWVNMELMLEAVYVSGD